MKFTIVVFAFIAIFVLAMGNSIQEDVGDDSTDEPLGRQGRLTCDFFGSTRFCVANCWRLGFKGGWCDSRNVCNCRR
ncbi:unnamed protein product [Chironomus riparius]|uniref:Invertebrate defensins family profile domain-containing protein n=1 Tax=Chironomus riparius TaxID=315576 RepID=A0A9N9S5B8_9DIPT|nr:unnamed protein product [Chironomus riparius]